MNDQGYDRVETKLPSTGGVFALGNFDGVHRGHQAVIKAAIEKARLMNVSVRVLTLEPHPRTLLRPEVGFFRLTPQAAKKRLLRGFGVDDVVVQNFTPEFAAISAADFANQILADDLKANHIVAGFDFVFGHQRTGDMKQLRTWLAAKNIGVTEVMPFRDHTGQVMSSSRTREALRQGDIETAKHILGRLWTISGVVQSGAKRGRHIGFPTANMDLGEYLRPKFGVYAVTGGRPGLPHNLQGVANIGVRPTVDGAHELLEAHFFDFDGDLYGQELEVALKKFIRPEQSFNDIESLRAQIVRDAEQARKILAVRD